MSMLRLLRSSLPESSVSSRASCSTRSRISSPAFHRMRARSAAETRPHSPSKALRAEATARSASSRRARAPVVSTPPVAGFGVSKVSPASASRGWPSIQSLPGRTLLAIVCLLRCAVASELVVEARAGPELVLQGVVVLGAEAHDVVGLRRDRDAAAEVVGQEQRGLEAVGVAVDVVELVD